MNSIFILALIVAFITRVVTQEALFIEVQRWAAAQQTKAFWRRKLTYPLQCQFCFSVWVAFALSIYLFFHQPFDMVMLSMSDAFLIVTLATTFILSAIANVYLIVYEFATVRVQAMRLGNQHRQLAVESRRLELGEFKKDIEIMDQRRKAIQQRSFIGYGPTNPGEWSQ